MSENIFACVLALVVGTIMVTPHVYFINELGENYHGIYMLESDAELHYLARVREFVDGNSYGNPYIYDFKDNVPTTFFTLGEGLLALPSIIFDISVVNMNLIYKFILPALLTLLIYGFFRRLGFDKKYSVAGTSLIILGHALLYWPSLLAFLRLEPIAQQFSLYARPVNPQLSSFFFFGYLHLSLSALNSKKWKDFILMGILFGGAFYIYFYSFTFIAAFNATLFMILLISNQKHQALKVFAATLIGIAIGLPAIKALIDLQTHPYFPELGEYLSVNSTHAPLIGISYVLTLLIFLVYFFKSEKKPKLYLLLALLATMFAVTNQQVITGREVHVGHFIWYFGGPILITVILFLLSKLLLHKKYLNNFFVAIFIFLAFSSSIFHQYSSYEFWVEDYTSRQDYGAVLDWINENAEPESAVFAHEELSDLIPVFTAANIGWAHHYALTYLLPNERDHLSMQDLFDSNFETPYRLDYIVWDKQKNPEWKIGVGELVYSDERFDIYALTASKI